MLRNHGTERAFTSPLDKEHRAGTFSCAGRDLPLFSSTTKFDSRTGWPSFTAPLENAVGTTVDRSFFTTPTEVHCRRCGGHLGHVFDDGPPPTGLRYCMNGVAMKFGAGGRRAVCQRGQERITHARIFTCPALASALRISCRSFGCRSADCSPRNTGLKVFGAVNGSVRRMEAKGARPGASYTLLLTWIPVRSLPQS